MASTELQHAWYELTRARAFTSVALVPVEAGSQTLVLAQEMAALASRDPRQRVLVINATGVPLVQSRMPPPANGLPGREVFSENGVTPMAGGRFGMLDYAQQGVDENLVGMVHVPEHTAALRDGKSPFTRIIVATNSPMVNPASVSAARATDTVVVCVTLGRTSFYAGRRILELVGDENVAGSITFRPRNQAA